MIIYLLMIRKRCGRFEYLTVSTTTAYNKQACVLVLVLSPMVCSGGVAGFIVKCTATHCTQGTTHAPLRGGCSAPSRTLKLGCFILIFSVINRSGFSVFKIAGGTGPESSGTTKEPVYTEEAAYCNH